MGSRLFPERADNTYRGHKLAPLGLVVLVRYRALIPFMFVLLLLDRLARNLILQLIPIGRTGTPPASAVTFAILAVTILGLLLSLWRRQLSLPDGHPG